MNIAAALLLLASGASNVAEPNDQQIAEACQVAVEQFRAVRQRVETGLEGKLTKVGRCYLSKSGKRLSIGYISEPPTEPK